MPSVERWLLGCAAWHSNAALACAPKDLALLDKNSVSDEAYETLRDVVPVGLVSIAIGSLLQRLSSEHSGASAAVGIGLRYLSAVLDRAATSDAPDAAARLVVVVFDILGRFVGRWSSHFADNWSRAGDLWDRLITCVRSSSAASASTGPIWRCCGAAFLRSVGRVAEAACARRWPDVDGSQAAAILAMRFCTTCATMILRSADGMSFVIQPTPSVEGDRHHRSRPISPRRSF
jgi:hypothetical protein